MASPPAEEKSKLEKKRDQIKNLRNEWFSKAVMYTQNINYLGCSECDDFCQKVSEWILKEDKSKWVDCFKQISDPDLNPFLKSNEIN